MAKLEIDTDRFEYPLPIVKADISEISFETEKYKSGSFVLRNAGSGVLSGSVASGARCMRFSPESFTGNKVVIFYEFNQDIYKKGDTINTSALILSNGGELTIPVAIRLTPPGLLAREGARLVTLRDFGDYAAASPAQAARLLFSEDFRNWLLELDYPYIEMFDRLLAMPEKKERVLESFLVFNSLKNAARLEALENNAVFAVTESQREPISGVIPLRLEGRGFFEASVRSLGGAGWLRLITDRISGDDFDNNNFFEASFIVYPNLVDKKYQYETIVISDLAGGTASRDISVSVGIIKKSAVECELSRECFRNDEKGKLLVRNVTRRDLMLEVTARDSFVKFEGKRYLVGETAEIAFSVKFTAIQAAQIAFQKKPYVETFINVKSVADSVAFQKELRVLIGNIV